MPLYSLFLFLNIAVNNSCTNYANTSRTDSENNKSLKLRQLQSHLHNLKLAVSFSRDRCIYHIHNYSKMKSSNKGTLAHSFSCRRTRKHFKYLRRGIPYSVSLRESRKPGEIDGQSKILCGTLRTKDVIKSLRIICELICERPMWTQKLELGGQGWESRLA